jgi:hypothetical protein
MAVNMMLQVQLHPPLPPINPSTFSTRVCCLFSLLPGYGITCVLEDGNLLEKAAANISVVRGTLTAARAQAMSSRGRSSIDPAGGQPYSAAALSLVFHSAHPMVPTLRADVRLFQVRAGVLQLLLLLLLLLVLVVPRSNMLYITQLFVVFFTG